MNLPTDLTIKPGTRIKHGETEWTMTVSGLEIIGGMLCLRGDVCNPGHTLLLKNALVTLDQDLLGNMIVMGHGS